MIQNSLSSFLHEADQRDDSQLEVSQVELFVGGVQVVVGQAEAHHHTGQAQMAGKVPDNWNGAAGADEDRVTAPNLVERARGSLDVGIVDRNQAGVSGVDQPHVDFDAIGGDLLNELFVQREGL